MFRGHSGEKAKEPMGAQLLVTVSAGHTKAFPRASLPPFFLPGAGSLITQ